MPGILKNRGESFSINWGVSQSFAVIIISVVVFALPGLMAHGACTVHPPLSSCIKALPPLPVHRTFNPSPTLPLSLVSWASSALLPGPTHGTLIGLAAAGRGFGARNLGCSGGPRFLAPNP